MDSHPASRSHCHRGPRRSTPAELLNACEAFDQIALSDEDRKRANLYQLDHKNARQCGQKATVSSDFLTTLQIRVTTGRVDGDTLPRVAQLINKTNQFNLTGRRYTESQIQQQIDSGSHRFMAKGVRSLR